MRSLLPVLRVVKCISWRSRSILAQVNDARSPSRCPVYSPNFIKDCHSGSAMAKTAFISGIVNARRPLFRSFFTSSTNSTGFSRTYPSRLAVLKSMRKTDMYRLIEVLESFPGRELRKAIKSALATSLKSRFAFGPRKSKNAEIRYGIGLESGPGDFRLFGFEPLIRIGARGSDRHVSW